MKMKVNDIELFYEVHGEGEPIIFSHGWMCDCSVWNSQIEFFSEKYKVIAYDQRGHGKSDKPKSDYSIETLSNDLYSLIQELNLEKVILVGHSMGGMTAITFALNHPDKVSKLVLVGTSAKMNFSGYIQIWIMMHIFSYESFARGMIDLLYDPSEQVKKEAFDRAMNTQKFVSYDCATEFMKNYDKRDRVSKIKVPTLIVVGEKDKATPVKMSRYLNREIKDSKLKIIPDSKHMVIIDKANELNEIIDMFIG
ncbi:MAG: alpha/beta hydrolase [ANME-2 cluster archaeon]|nr:alpha/beta hydrolase [ANME-2 cluster archaeon]MBC2707930.1 alpha/beta hydrolase [ANME-2 cluster archaeon]MBC2746957.1 alpha/beta hydrolase [ANME-2 cluster archaeon]